MMSRWSDEAESGVRAWLESLESVNVHAVDAACASLPTTTVWDI